MQKSDVLLENLRHISQNLPQILNVLGILSGSILGIAIILVCAGINRKHADGCSQPVFTSMVEEDLVTRDRDGYSKKVDISKIRTFSFLVRNDGPNPVVVQPEQSPDGVTWSSFGELAYVLESGEKHLFVPQYFLRFARVKFRSKKPGFNSVITVWFQGQS